MRSAVSPSSICVRCLVRKRLFSTASPLREANGHGLPPQPPPAGYSRLANRGLISITGTDSTTFLQGLITQNMLISNDPSRAVRRTGAYTAFLNSHGRVLNDAFIYPLSDGDDGWLIEVDKNEVPTLLKHLKKHKLRAKLKLRALEDGERTVWSSWNEKNSESPKWAAYGMLNSSKSTSSAENNTITGCVDTRAPGFGSRFVTPGSDDLRLHVSNGLAVGNEVDLGVYTVRRMLHGIAEGQGEIVRESALPLECNLDMMRGVDFRKGCYIGQELTIRTHHTGVVRKRVLPVQLYDTSSTDTNLTDDGMPIYSPSANITVPPSGSNISRAGGRRGRSAGKFLGGIGNIGLGLCRLEMMTDIALTGEVSQYSPGQEFKVSWDDSAGEGSSSSGEMNVKAIVPPWAREYILYGGVRKKTPPEDSGDGSRARDMVEQLEEKAAQRQTE